MGSAVPIKSIERSSPIRVLHAVHQIGDRDGYTSRMLEPGESIWRGMVCMGDCTAGGHVIMRNAIICGLYVGAQLRYFHDVFGIVREEMLTLQGAIARMRSLIDGDA